ncbi:MAG: DNA-directed RNA polymerase subunit beta [Dialister micraerophilus]|nr:DNA-directed RNA polymerase subunit beta [Dialister micraerophilus]MDK8253766.1 DNA-directed RNA polymerase subunit beta [Dialister micraerophilus]
MPKSKMFRPVQVGKRKRYTYARSQEVLEMPHLLDLQTRSYDWFKAEGLKDVFADISPIEDGAHKWALYFGSYSFGEEKYNIEECKSRDATYCAPLHVQVRLVNKESGEIKEHELFMGDFPIMTDTGTFIINGAERVIVSQLVRSPGVYYKKELDTFGKEIYNAQIIPNRGAWIELETDAGGVISVRIDRNRKMPVTVLVRALGYSSNDEILNLFDHDIHIIKTLEKDSTTSTEEALLEIYRKLRPGEPATVESGTTLLNNFFYDPRRYDLAKVGRYKLNKKLSWKNRLLGNRTEGPIVNTETGEIVIDADSYIDKEAIELLDKSGVFANTDQVEVMTQKEDGTPVKVICSSGNREDNFRILERADIIAYIDYLLNMMQGYGSVDDIDHLGNRRVRCVGELLQNQFRIGLSRMERVVRERMTTQDQDKMTPQVLVNIRPVVAAIKEFFGSSQLSQFMDQTNPLAELTHKRRLSALGPGGLSRERAGFEVRDVHYSHYGRMCPVETPEGPNIGLISSLSNYGIINKYGLIETPYRLIDKKAHRVTNECKYYTADVEDSLVIAQASEPLDDEGRFVHKNVASRYGADVLEADSEEVDLMDVSPKQVVSIGTSLIPFLEHDDTNRALMGANMQRQAVPLLRPEAPLVGTGMEWVAAQDSGVCLLAKRSGVVEKVTGKKIIVRADNGELDTYELIKFLRSNQSTCINQRPLVYKGDRVETGSTLADGMATDGGELALGHNVLVAFVSWEGYNHEDAVLISERLCKDDLYTSIHIEEYECDARDTKLGEEEITRQLSSVSEDAVRYLDENGIIMVGADVRPGDILVGKVTPKGETELTPEERLLRAIFGDKEREVRDTSLRVPHGEFGKVVDVKVFTRENGDELAPGVNKLVRVYIAQKRKIREGDKMAGRHGNKCVCSRILPVEDMPFTPDGRPVDLVLNPLGVPSRMNIGQILEIHLSWACHMLGEEIKKNPKEVEKRLRALGYDFDKYGMPEPDESGIHIATPVFDGCRDEDLAATLKAAGLPETGKSVIYDGRTGEKLDGPVTIGWKYMLKLHHLVDDKIHARSTGPYSLVTQQPLGGKAQFGGQRFGEMEVWALEAYGAAYTLQEILTVKSDDVVGRVKAYEKIVKGQNIPSPGVPESFKVLMKELQSIGLDVRVLNENGDDVILKELDENEYDSGNEHEKLYKAPEENKEEKEDIKKLIEGDDALIHSRSVFETGMSGENVVENNDVASFNDVQNMDTDAPSDGGFVPGDFESDDGQDS